MKPVSAPNCLISSCTFSSKPVISAETSMMTLTPRTTPNTVKPLRILWARSVSMACLRFSPWACAIWLSVRTQCFDGIKPGGTHGGVDSEEQAHSRGHCQGQNYCVYLHLHGNRGDRTTQCHQPPGQQDADDSTDGGEHRGLGHELQHDMFLARTQ